MSNESKAVQTADVRAITPMDMLSKAVEQGADLDKLEKLMQLEREWKADKAREAYVEAMSAFRSEAIAIVKTKGVSYNNELKYRYAQLADVLAQAVPLLSKHGLSHRWETTQEGDRITVKCIVTHIKGHSESTSLTAGPDASGGMNSIQAIGSATSYLERYTFMAITGLAAKEQDDDGRGSEPLELIDEKQVANLEALIEEVGANRKMFLKWAKVGELSEIPARAYKTCVDMLEAKRRQ